MLRNLCSGFIIYVMAGTNHAPNDMSSGEAEDIMVLGTFEQLQNSASSEPVTRVQTASVSELRLWYTKAIRDATSDDPPEEFATLKIGVGVLPEWKGSQKAEYGQSARRTITR